MYPESNRRVYVGSVKRKLGMRFPKAIGVIFAVDKISSMQVPELYGGALNFTTITSGGEDLKSSEETRHYANDQYLFGKKSQIILHEASKQFKEFFEKIRKAEVITRSSLFVEEFEQIYKFLTQSRLLLVEGLEIQEDFRILNAMLYKERRPLTATNLTQIKDGRFTKYSKVQESHPLFISEIADILGIEIAKENDFILAGIFKKKYKEEYHHCMNYYLYNYERNGIVVCESYDGIDIEKRNNIVDHITCLCAQKAIQSDNLEESLKYAFTFGVLRGLSVRSTIGAGWVHEMSLRLILDEMGLPQFKKSPGIALDIEACLIDKPGDFKIIIDKMVSDYMQYTLSLTTTQNPNLDKASGNNSFFTYPKPKEILDPNLKQGNADSKPDSSLKGGKAEQVMSKVLSNCVTTR